MAYNPRVCEAVTTPTSVIAVLPDERRDRQLIKLLLAHLKRIRGRVWTSLDFPDERIRSRDAVQMIAMEQSGRVTAIEHVALDGFAGETQEAQRFLPLFSELEREASLRAAGFHVDVAIPVHLVPPGVDSKLLANSVRGWCLRHVASAPEGRATHVIMVSRTALRIQVDKVACPGESGRLSITRADPPRNFEAVVHDRLQQKLARLVAASADKRVMLVEKSDALWNLSQLRVELESASLEFPELNALTEVWMADTVGWKAGSSAAFRVVLQNEVD